MGVPVYILLKYLVIGIGIRALSFGHKMHNTKLKCLISPRQMETCHCLYIEGKTS